MKLFFALVLICLAFVSAKDFSQSSVIIVRIDNEQDFSKFSKAFPLDTIDMWSETYAAKEDMEINFSKQQVLKLAKMFFQKNTDIKFTKFEVAIKNVQELLNNEAKQMKAAALSVEQKSKLLKTQKERDDLKFSSEEWFKSYHNLADNVAYYNKIASDYPTMVDKEVIGKSIEGRDIVVLRLHSPGQYDSSKPSIFVESLQHAREWVSPPTTQYLVKTLLSSFKTDTRANSILQKLNIHWVPLVNPDGFHFTHTSNRMWRKNRRRNRDGSFGVDLNRNWKSGFGGSGSSGSPRSDVYRGTGVFSEPETKAIDDYLTKYASEMKGALDFHAYSQLNLRPWGKTRSVSPDERKLLDLGAKMCDALKKVHGQTYRNIRAAQLYVAGGLASDDWYESHKLLAYTFELRPSNAWGGGFALPARFILPTCQENYPAILVFAEHIIAQEEKKNNGSSVLDKLLREIK